MAQRSARRTGAPRTPSRDRRPTRPRDNEGIVPVLAKAVRQVEAAAQRGKVRPSGRTAYQVVAILLREERARVKEDNAVSEGERTAVLTRLDGIATILAKTAARDTSLLELLAEGAVVWNPDRESVHVGPGQYSRARVGPCDLRRILHGACVRAPDEA